LPSAKFGGLISLELRRYKAYDRIISPVLTVVSGKDELSSFIIP
jgi:hypothetical protein